MRGPRKSVRGGTVAHASGSYKNRRSRVRLVYDRRSRVRLVSDVTWTAKREGRAAHKCEPGVPRVGGTPGGGHFGSLLLAGLLALLQPVEFVHAGAEFLGVDQ